VAGVVSGGTAARAGIGSGDIVTWLGGHQVTSGARLSELMATYHPGEKVKIRWVDTTGRSHVATVTLKAGPPA
jgi:S1-C subfamily serine protease